MSLQYKIMEENKNLLEISKELLEDKSPKILEDFEGILFARGSCGNKPC
jgi:hypothetical protein